MINDDNWDEEKISRQFETTARLAENYYKEIQHKLSRTNSYKNLSDEHLSKFYIYNSLHGKTFLNSRESFLKHLEFLLENVNFAHSYFDKEIYKKYWVIYINELINRFKI